MNQKNKLLSVALFILTLCSPFNIYASEGIEMKTEDKIDYIRWFGTYDDEKQTTLKEIKADFVTLMSDGTIEMTRAEIITLLGEPAETFDVGASQFLVYYSINNEESDILYVQLFSEEDQTKEPYLAEVNLLIVNENDFEPLNITEEQVLTWQDDSKENREFTSVEDLIDVIGEPSELTYNFQQDTRRFAWIRNSVAVSGLNYVVAETDKDGSLHLIDTFHKQDENKESIEHSLDTDEASK